MRKQKLYFEDIINAMDKIEKYIKNLDKDSFTDNEMVVDAVLRNLEIIGEAAGNISDDIKNKYSNIPWRRMIGLRNIVIHDYFGVDLNIIWEIIKVNLPETKPLINKVMDNEYNNE
ncbi:MAG: hypothetical protein PWR10_2361 [Halanaerobiales bacterium]|nr:hypothetical protein [Halanaerobiales bacterium]